MRHLGPETIHMAKGWAKAEVAETKKLAPLEGQIAVPTEGKRLCPSSAWNLYLTHLTQDSVSSALKGPLPPFLFLLFL